MMLFPVLYAYSPLLSPSSSWVYPKQWFFWCLRDTLLSLSLSPFHSINSTRWAKTHLVSRFSLTFLNWLSEKSDTFPWFLTLFHPTITRNQWVVVVTVNVLGETILQTVSLTIFHKRLYFANVPVYVCLEVKRFWRKDLYKSLWVRKKEEKVDHLFPVEFLTALTFSSSSLHRNTILSHKRVNH